MNASLTGSIAVALYIAASVMVVRVLRRGTPPGRSLALIALLAVGFHATALWQSTVSPEGVRLGLFSVASMVTGTGAALVALASLYRRLEWISALVFPLSALVLPAVLWLDIAPAPEKLGHGLAAHVLLSILAFAVLAVATAQSVFLLIQHRQLKEGHIRGIMGSFPPVQTMERMLFELIWTGVLLLTGAIVTGFIYLDDLIAQHVAHKTVLTLLAWALFTVLLGGRHLLGWRAVTAVRLTLGGFVVLVLAFFGSQFVLEILLERS